MLGNDELHAGSVGSSMNGGGGSDRLFSSAADDQWRPDGTSSDSIWTVHRTCSSTPEPGGGARKGAFSATQFPDSRTGRTCSTCAVAAFSFSDLTIVNDDFQTTITSSRGTITIFESDGQEVFIDENDFLFGPAPATIASDPPLA